MTARHSGKPPSSNRLLSWMITVAATMVLPFPLTASASDSGTEIFGLRLGMTTEAVKQEFNKGGISVTEIDAETFSAPRLPTPLAGVTEARFIFERGRLNKIVVHFAIPPPEPTAANLTDRYSQEKDRLTKLFGPPLQDIIEMKAPAAQRYEWLVRARGYYRTSWKTPDQMTITLWLYGEDAGIVFMEIYEGPQKI